MQSLSITSPACVKEQTTAIKQPSYPPQIIENIETALTGMAYVYTLPDSSESKTAVPQSASHEIHPMVRRSFQKTFSNPVDEYK